MCLKTDLLPILKIPLKRPHDIHNERQELPSKVNQRPRAIRHSCLQHLLHMRIVYLQLPFPGDLPHPYLLGILDGLPQGEIRELEN